MKYVPSVQPHPLFPPSSMRSVPLGMAGKREACQASNCQLQGCAAHRAEVCCLAAAGISSSLVELHTMVSTHIETVRPR